MNTLRFNCACFSSALLYVSALGSVWAQLPNEPATKAVLVNQSRTSAEELVRRALDANKGFLASRKQIDEAQGLLQQAGVRPNPTLQTNVLSGPAVGNSGESEISVSYSHTFELGGKRDKRVNVATLSLKATESTAANLERQLRADVKARYVEALSAGRNLATVRNLLSITEQTYRISEARRVEGEGPALDVRLIDVERNRLRSEELLLESQLQRSILELKVLAGIDTDDELLLQEDDKSPPTALPAPDFIERALNERPDIQAARANEQRATAEAELAHAEAVPNITGSIGYTNSRSRFPQFGTTASGAISRVSDNDNLLAVGISIPLPVRDRNQGNIYAAESRSAQARLRRQFLEQTAKREIEAALTRFRAALRARELFDERINRQAEENLRVVRASYDLGETRLTDVLTEQRRLIETKKAYNEVVKEHQLSLIELERLAGNLQGETR
jgi:cobalt-zinc-cadmium efflux system outer membrane protein